MAKCVVMKFALVLAVMLTYRVVYTQDNVTQVALDPEPVTLIGQDIVAASDPSRNGRQATPIRDFRARLQQTQKRIEQLKGEFRYKSDPAVRGDFVSGGDPTSDQYVLYGTNAAPPTYRKVDDLDPKFADGCLATYELSKQRREELDHLLHLREEVAKIREMLSANSTDVVDSNLARDMEQMKVVVAKFIGRINEWQIGAEKIARLEQKLIDQEREMADLKVRLEQLVPHPVAQTDSDKVPLRKLHEEINHLNEVMGEFLGSRDDPVLRSTQDPDLEGTLKALEAQLKHLEGGDDPKSKMDKLERELRELYEENRRIRHETELQRLKDEIRHLQVTKPADEKISKLEREIEMLKPNKASLLETKINHLENELLAMKSQSKVGVRNQLLKLQEEIDRLRGQGEEPQSKPITKDLLDQLLTQLDKAKPVKVKPVAVIPQAPPQCVPPEEDWPHVEAPTSLEDEEEEEETPKIEYLRAQIDQLEQELRTHTPRPKVTRKRVHLRDEVGHLREMLRKLENGTSADKSRKQGRVKRHLGSDELNGVLEELSGAPSNKNINWMLGTQKRINDLKRKIAYLEGIKSNGYGSEDLAKYPVGARASADESPTYRTFGLLAKKKKKVATKSLLKLLKLLLIKFGLSKSSGFDEDDDDEEEDDDDDFDLKREKFDFLGGKGLIGLLPVLFKVLGFLLKVLKKSKFLKVFLVPALLIVGVVGFMLLVMWWMFPEEKVPSGKDFAGQLSELL